MKFNKAQFSVVEIVFLLFLFVGVSSLIVFDFKLPTKNYNSYLESGLNAIYYSSDYRDIIIAEDLSLPGLTEDWTNLNQTLNSMMGDFELIVSNESDSKIIFSCTESSGKFFDERIIAVNNGSIFNFRKLTLGVCY